MTSQRLPLKCNDAISFSHLEQLSERALLILFIPVSFFLGRMGPISFAYYMFLVNLMPVFVCTDRNQKAHSTSMRDFVFLSEPNAQSFNSRVNVAAFAMTLA